jgi:NADP-dependent 3-hydroxy acid dehydrogenase YdfG
MDRVQSGIDPYIDAEVIVAGRDLSGRTAIVTGGASGIGLETVQSLAGARA